MKMVPEKGSIIFDNLLSANRSLGSDESISMPKPAEKAVACNASGVFENRTLEDIHSSAKESASKLVDMLQK